MKNMITINNHNEVTFTAIKRFESSIAVFVEYGESLFWLPKSAIIRSKVPFHANDFREMEFTVMKWIAKENGVL